MRFHVTSHEGSIVLSCVTTLELSLIQPHTNVDSITFSASLISSNTDYPRKKGSQKNVQVLKPSKNMSPSKEQSPIALPSHGYSVNQCVVDEDKYKTSNQEWTAYDKNCQSTLCYDKNSQCVHMWQVKPAMKSSNMWLVEPGILKSSYKNENQVKQESLCDEKTVNLPRNIVMKSVMTRTVNLPNLCVMTRTTRCAHMQKPAMPQSNYKMGTQSTHLQSVSKAARKQIGTQPEITRNCQDSTSKCCYPSVSTICVQIPES